jgi:CheY-like chemotaxis protein
MSLVFRFALLGLPPVDSTLIESLFRQGLSGGAACDRVHELDQADLIIVNADDGNTVRALRARGLPVPVLLIGDSDAGTGWPVVSRPVQLRAIMQAASQLAPQLNWGAARSAQAAPGPTHPATPAQPAPDQEPGFQATAPFAPLESPGASGADDYSGFADTRPFELSASGALAAPPSASRRPVQYDPIDVRSVLKWREAQANATAASPDDSDDSAITQSTELVAETASTPAPHGAETSGDADHPEPMPGDWREHLQQQARARQPPDQPAGPGAGLLSSSFADRSQQLTVPPPHSTSGPVPAILLLGEDRLAESSLIRVLRGFGYRVDYVSDGEMALSSLESQEYGFAFLDSFSLGAQTVPVCRALRKRAQSLGQSRLNIVVLAGKGDMLRRLFARMAGCDAWITVPLDRKRLRKYLRSRI